ncbi:hypothetical protein DL95DRAFT_386916 [Leptodontidium sp. 2 PMI_412]|nr:hypothetical protein DL95DRAFT_386916 [Leptodontidium sp. 2 PMI_412]
MDVDGVGVASDRNERCVCARTARWNVPHKTNRSLSWVIAVSFVGKDTASFRLPVPLSRSIPSYPIPPLLDVELACTGECAGQG